jgi:2-hydroxychromene-2-carboxylate isomerase
MSELRLDPVPLRVLLDLRNPLSYLALGPTRALAAELGIEVDWLPLTAPPLNPPSQPAPDDDRGVRHRRSRAQALARDIETYAAAQGLVIRDYYRAPDTEPASRAWLWLREQHPKQLPDFLEALFRGYWEGKLDPSREDAVAALLERAGVPGAGLAAEGATATRELAAACEERGWFQAPGFVVEDEVFYGRQHLPMIRWILEGRSGPVPI